MHVNNTHYISKSFTWDLNAIFTVTILQIYEPTLWWDWGAYYQNLSISEKKKSASLIAFSTLSDP